MRKFKLSFIGLVTVLFISSFSTAFATGASDIKLIGNDIYLPTEAKEEIISLKLQWAEANTKGNIEEMTKAHNDANKIRDQHKGTYYAINGSTYTDEDIIRLGALINHEAGLNNRDRFMVGATFVNRWHSGRWGCTTREVLNSRGQYYNESYDRKHINFVNDMKANGYTKENNLFLYIANLCLYGDFTIPSNIYGQSAGIQGKLYMKVDNNLLSGVKQGFYNHYYCVMPYGDAMSNVDWAGNTAITANEAIWKIDDLSLLFSY